MTRMVMNTEMNKYLDAKNEGAAKTTRAVERIPSYQRPKDIIVELRRARLEWCECVQQGQRLMRRARIR